MGDKNKYFFGISPEVFINFIVVVNSNGYVYSALVYFVSNLFCNKFDGINICVVRLQVFEFFFQFTFRE